jgi:hypothetical protein
MALEILSQAKHLYVRQKKEWGEILTGFETRNRYEIKDDSGCVLFTAQEESSFLLRWFVKSLRPCQIHIYWEADSREVLRLHRRFRFFLHRIEVYDESDRFLGSVQKRFTFLRRVYVVRDENEQEVCSLFGPILHPWTFEIRRNDVAFGAIRKKWSGIGKEMFTDADNFGIEFPTAANAEVRTLLLGAVFLIDLVHFEKSQR